MSLFVDLIVQILVVVEFETEQSRVVQSSVTVALMQS